QVRRRRVRHRPRQNPQGRRPDVRRADPVRRGGVRVPPRHRHRQSGRSLLARGRRLRRRPRRRRRQGTLRCEAAGTESSRAALSGVMADLTRLLDELLEIGIALTSERDLGALLERILSQARRVTRAEAGTVFLRDGDHLRFAVVQNDFLEPRLGEDGSVVPFDPGYEKLVRALASQAALAIRNARLEDLSFKDPLTDLFNRRYFALRLDEEAKRAARFGHPLSLVYLDLDDFKKLN